MAYGVSNGHMIDDVTMTPIRLERNISKTTGDAIYLAIMWGSTVGYNTATASACLLVFHFLPDRTNGRAYATVLGLSVCLSSVCL